MKRFLPFAFFAALLVAAIAAKGATDIGPIVIGVDKDRIAIRVSANTPELNTLAQRAFASHGRYTVQASGHAFDIRFTAVSATQVRVDIAKGSAATPVASEVATGTNARHALLRAADLAVEKTNGVGLRGFFTARLAFIGERTGKKEIYVADLFPAEVKQVTHDNALALSPRWSPDGSRLLYTSFFKSGFPDIFQIELGGYQRTTFVSFRGTNSGARFSPNGQQVAMILSGEGTPEIYVGNAQGRQVSRKTRSDAVKSSPCWSPDGSRLVFVMDPGPQLYTMSAAGGPMQRLVTGFSYSSEPDWSRANPSKIACTVRDGGRYKIAVYDVSRGTATVASTKVEFDGIEPSWLADGRHLVYTARNRSTSVLCILDTETGKSTPISQITGAAMQASVWTP
jgi:TolB protein